MANNRARVFWELDWDGEERTRKGAFAEARRRIRAGKQVVVEHVWVWGPRPGFPNGKRIELGRWYCPDKNAPHNPHPRRLKLSRRAFGNWWQTGASQEDAARIYKRKYRRWRPSYNTWM